MSCGERRICAFPSESAQRRSKPSERVDVGEIGPPRVAFGLDSGDKRPIDVKSGIIPSNAYFGLRSVGARDEIGHFGIVCEGLESMGETRGDVEYGVVGVSEFKALPASVGRGGATKVDDYVKHGAANTTHHFDLGMRRSLKVHSAERALEARTGGVVLNEPGLQSPFCERLFTERSHEETAFVTLRIQFDQAGIGEGGWLDLHPKAFARNFGSARP